MTTAPDSPHPDLAAEVEAALMDDDFLSDVAASLVFGTNYVETVRERVAVLAPLVAAALTAAAPKPVAEGTTVRVGFRYRDGEVLTSEREVLSEDDEIPVAVIDLGDGEWLSLGDLRDQHAERLEADLAAWDDESAEVDQ